MGDDFEPWKTSEYATAAQTIVETGFAELTIDDAWRVTLDTVFRSAAEFFASPLPVKREHAAGERTTGYREIGEEYSVSTDFPDTKESFSYLRAECASLQWSTAPPLLRACRSAARLFDQIAMSVLKPVAAHFGSSDIAYAGENSHLQVNWYPGGDDGPVIVPHEDGGIVTLVAADRDGLEVARGDGFHRVNMSQSVAILAGETLRLLTGGAVPPIIHQVRRIADPNPRISIAYHANADISRNVEPWLAGAANRENSIRRHTIENPTRFGLPPLRLPSGG